MESALPTHFRSSGVPPLGRMQVYPFGQHIPSSAHVVSTTVLTYVSFERSALFSMKRINPNLKVSFSAYVEICNATLEDAERGIIVFIVDVSNTSVAFRTCEETFIHVLIKETLFPFAFDTIP